MRPILTLIFLAFFTSAFSQTDSLQFSKYNINIGASLGTQMAFLAALDMGAFSNIESQPFNSPFSIMGGIELRNRWFMLDVGQSAGIEDLKTHHSIVSTLSAGLGLTFVSKTKMEKNSFYFTANPYFFLYKESVSNEHFNNTISRSFSGLNAGISWSNTRITKKGRRINTQFYLPLIGKHFLDDLRYMSLKFGISIL